MAKFNVKNIDGDKVKKVLGIATAVGGGLVAVFNALKDQKHEDEFNEMAKNYKELKEAFDASKKN